MKLCMRSMAFAVSIALLPLPLVAQDDAALRAAAESYISSPSQQEMIDRLLAPDAIRAQISAARPDLPVELLVEIGTIASEELSIIRPQLEAAMVDAAVETFTQSEIEALDTFYRTPEGQAVLLKNPAFMQLAMTSVGPDMREVQQKIMSRTQEIMSNMQ